MNDFLKDNAFPLTFPASFILKAKITFHLKRKKEIN